MTNERVAEVAVQAADRIAGILHNSPRSEYVRLTRREAEAIVEVLLDR